MGDDEVEEELAVDSIADQYVHIHRLLHLHTKRSKNAKYIVNIQDLSYN